MERLALTTRLSCEMERNFDGVFYWRIPKGFRQYFHGTEPPPGWTLITRFCRIGKKPLILCRKD